MQIPAIVRSQETEEFIGELRKSGYEVEDFESYFIIKEETTQTFTKYIFVAVVDEITLITPSIRNNIRAGLVVSAALYVKRVGADNYMITAERDNSLSIELVIINKQEEQKPKTDEGRGKGKSQNSSERA